MFIINYMKEKITVFFTGIYCGFLVIYIAFRDWFCFIRYGEDTFKNLYETALNISYIVNTQTESDLDIIG